MNKSALSVEERLDRIQESGWPIAYDGCHKLYFLQDDKRLVQAVEYGYTIYPAEALKDLWSDTCALRFVTRWGFDNDDFEHELNINQFDEEEATGEHVQAREA